MPAALDYGAPFLVCRRTLRSMSNARLRRQVVALEADMRVPAISEHRIRGCALSVRPRAALRIAVPIIGPDTEIIAETT